MCSVSIENAELLLIRNSVVADGYYLVAADKSHARIIWDCAWAHEGDVFATASRDKSVRSISILSYIHKTNVRLL